MYPTNQSYCLFSWDFDKILELSPDPKGEQRIYNWYVSLYSQGQCQRYRDHCGSLKTKKFRLWVVQDVECGFDFAFSNEYQYSVNNKATYK